MTLEEYRKLLAEHDWHYDRSDSPAQYRNGVGQRQRLRSVANNSVAHSNLFDAFLAYSTGTGPEPKIETRGVPET